jgi:hypothetical protein
MKEGPKAHKKVEPISIRPKARAKGDSMSSVLRGFQRTLELGTFADAGRLPKISDVEVVICFADLRGFTQYVHELQKNGQDNKVQNFLQDYLPIYSEAVLKGIRSLEPTYLDQDITEEEAEVQKLLVPTSYKNLGDGMMLIWELQSVSDMYVQGLTTRRIFQTILDIQHAFRKLVNDPGEVQIDAYSRHAQALLMPA